MLQDLCDAKAVMFNICSLLASRLAFATTFLIDDFVDEIAVCFTLNILQSHCFFFLLRSLHSRFAMCCMLDSMKNSFQPNKVRTACLKWWRLNDNIIAEMRSLLVPIKHVF